MHAGEHDRLRQHLDGRADTGHHFVDGRLRRGPGQVVRAFVIDVLEAHARRDRPAAEIEPVLHEGRQRLDGAVAVFLDARIAAGARVARRREVAVRLDPVLVLDVIAHAGLGDVVHAEQPVLYRHPWLETGRPELAQAAFVAAGRVQIRHAGARRIAGIVGALRRVARLPPPVAVEVRVVGVGRERHRGAQFDSGASPTCRSAAHPSRRT